MNWIGLQTLFLKEIRRSKAVLIQAFLAPVLTTFLYFLVFGTALGGRVGDINGISYDQFIVPGLIMMSLITNALLVASSAMYFPRFVGTINDLLAAPLSFLEIALGFALAAAARSVAIGATIFAVSWIFTGITIQYIFYTLIFMIITSLTFSFLGIVIGIWAKNFEGLSIIPTLVITPLSFLGGMFYSIEMLPSLWQNITLANPVFYLMDGLRYGFFGVSGVSPFLSFAIVIAMLATVAGILKWMFVTGYGLRS